jgi:hypothetical protein
LEQEYSFNIKQKEYYKIKAKITAPNRPVYALPPVSGSVFGMLCEIRAKLAEIIKTSSLDKCQHAL